MLEGSPIPVYNEGKMIRDFTYVGDIVEGICRVVDKKPEPNPNWTGDTPDPASSYLPYRVFNIGNNSPVQLMHYIKVLEDCLGVKANLDLLPMQAGDVPATNADTSELQAWVGYKPETTVEYGIEQFVKWYKAYFK